MKRLCSYCKLDMGEKCGGCGSIDVVNLGKPLHFADPSLPDLYECLRCHKTFVGGSGGVTHGICQKCLEVQVSEIKTAALGVRQRADSPTGVTEG